MKATIKADGTLEITPENDLESFALDKWFEDYEHGDKLTSAATVRSKLAIVNYQEVERS